MWKHNQILKECDLMIYVSIDVANEKRDCLIANSDDVIIRDVFIIPINRKRFNELYDSISLNWPKSKIIEDLKLKGITVQV